MINSPVPPVVGPATATVFIRSTDGQPMHGAAVLLEGSSIDPRVSPIQARASEMAPGVYRAHVVWPRAGSWFVVVYITFANGQTLMRQVELPYVQAH